MWDPSQSCDRWEHISKMRWTLILCPPVRGLPLWTPPSGCSLTTASCPWLSALPPSARPWATSCSNWFMPSSRRPLLRKETRLTAARWEGIENNSWRARLSTWRTSPSPSSWMVSSTKDSSRKTWPSSRPSQALPFSHCTSSNTSRASLRASRRITTVLWGASRNYLQSSNDSVTVVLATTFFRLHR